MQFSNNINASRDAKLPEALTIGLLTEKKQRERAYGIKNAFPYSFSAASRVQKKTEFRNRLAQNKLRLMHEVVFMNGDARIKYINMKWIEKANVK